MQAFALTADTIKAWAQRKQLPLLENKQIGQLALPHPKVKGFAIRFIPRPDRNMLTMAMPVPVTATDEHRAALLHGLSLATSSTIAGSWVHNHSKNETYFRVTVPTIGTGYTDQSLDFLVTIIFGTVDKIGPRLKAIAEGTAPPESVLDNE